MCKKEGNSNNINLLGTPSIFTEYLYMSLFIILTPFWFLHIQSSNRLFKSVQFLHVYPAPSLTLTIYSRGLLSYVHLNMEPLF